MGLECRYGYESLWISSSDKNAFFSHLFQNSITSFYLSSWTDVKLQKQASDVSSAYKEAQFIHAILRRFRDDSEKEFAKMFAKSQELGTSLFSATYRLTMPRIARSQLHRSNIETDSLETYYRVSLYNEFLSHCVRELQERLLDNSSHFTGLLHLLPLHCVSLDGDAASTELLNAVEKYSSDLPSGIIFPTEYKMSQSGNYVNLNAQDYLLTPSNPAMVLRFRILKPFCTSQLLCLSRLAKVSEVLAN
eukprot:m.220984 g.220984  ORF g.220984 m.220984 type:complete len:248 (+) comp39951_c2_seq40:696-1439(+)